MQTYVPRNHITCLGLFPIYVFVAKDFLLGKQIIYVIFPIVPSKCKITHKRAPKMIDRTQKWPFPKSAHCPLSILAKTPLIYINTYSNKCTH